ncbi:MAG: hypothetical protein Q7J57_08780 [Gemmobacter sp.]|nr:hypothetical protein [Gemmobacter sp.]
MVEQSGHDSKQQFSSSPSLWQTVVDAIIEAFDAHTSMSKEALDPTEVREGLIDVLLGPGQLYEALRRKGGMGSGRGGKHCKATKPGRRTLSHPIAWPDCGLFGGYPQKNLKKT